MALHGPRNRAFRAPRMCCGRPPLGWMRSQRSLASLRLGSRDKHAGTTAGRDGRLHCVHLGKYFSCRSEYRTRRLPKPAPLQGNLLGPGPFICCPFRNHLQPRKETTTAAPNVRPGRAPLDSPPEALFLEGPPAWLGGKRAADSKKKALGYGLSRDSCGTQSTDVPRDHGGHGALACWSAALLVSTAAVASLWLLMCLSCQLHARCFGAATDYCA